VKPLTSREIRGTWATVLLPISSNDSINWSRLADEIDILVSSGVDGIYSNGTAGEFYAQSEEEFDRLHEMLAGKCERAGMPFQIGASHSVAQISLQRVHSAASWKPGAIQVTLPDWFPVNEVEGRRFLETVAAVAAPIGLVLYNPPHAKRVLAPDELGRLAKAVPRLVGVKVAGGGEKWYAAMRENAPGLSLFVAGDRLASGILLGAAGSYSNVACLSPGGAKWWNGLMLTNPKGALAIEQQIQSFFARYIRPLQLKRAVSNQALDKLLAAIGGWAEIGLHLRWPYESVEEEQAIRLRPVIRNMVPELFRDENCARGPARASL
jgi:4-hydroxy-tetrahydrodipicolinate synthase